MCRCVFEFSARKTVSNRQHASSADAEVHTRPNLVHALKVRSNACLLRELRVLREERRALELVHFEYAAPAPHRRGLQLRRVDLHEPALVEVLALVAAHAQLNEEDRLVRRCAQVHRAVPQARLQGDAADAAGVRERLVVLVHGVDGARGVRNGPGG